MPLPDERPRKTVANLIGQFEKQKAASSTSTVPIVPRTSSVASHRTGDSAIEEVKEKREWPPKPAPPPVAVDHTPSVSPIPEPPKPSIVDTPSDTSPPLENVIESIPPVQITPPTPATPTPVIPNFEQNVPVVSKSKLETTATVAKTTPKAASGNASTPSKTSIIKTSPSKAAPAVAKSGGRTSISTPVKTPLKSTVTPRSPASSPLVSTPIRAKSPSEASTKTPLTRPKTPSHLYTPTAASLARSRNSPAPPPVEKPKRKLTTDLTKPTAASASKMRSVVTPTTVSRSPKPAAVAKPTIKSSTHPAKVVGTTRSTVKAPSRPNTANAAQKNSSATHNSRSAIKARGGSDLPLVHGTSEVEAETGDGGAQMQHSKGQEEIENYDHDFADESREPVDEPEQIDENLSRTHEPAEADHVSRTEDTTSFNLNGSPSSIVHESQTVESVVVENETGLETKSSLGAGAELEDLVDMLQTTPNIERPSFEAVSAGEIPDEHQ